MGLRRGTNPNRISSPAEDDPSHNGISEDIPFTRMALGLLSRARFELTKVGDAHLNRRRTPEGWPYICTEELLLGFLPVPVGAASEVLSRLGIDGRRVRAGTRTRAPFPA